MFSSPFQDRYNDTGPFKRQVNVFSVSVARKFDLENGDKILLPPTFLEELIRREISYPMMFKLENPTNRKSIYCGVIEFSAEAGTSYVPQWMMDQMGLGDGADMVIYNVTLQKGTFVLIRPHTYKFNLLPDPKRILETALVNYASLTRGTTIRIAYEGVIYYFDIQDLKPARAVCIIETDLNVDFSEPRDIKEYEAFLAAERKDRAIKDRFQHTANTPILHSNSNNQASQTPQMGAFNFGTDSSSDTPTNVFALSSPDPSETNQFLGGTTTGYTIKSGAVPATAPSSRVLSNDSQTTSTTSVGGGIFPSASSASTASASSAPVRDAEAMRNARAAGLLARFGKNKGSSQPAGAAAGAANKQGTSSMTTTTTTSATTNTKVEQVGNIIIEEDVNNTPSSQIIREVDGNWVYYKDSNGKLLRREPLDDVIASTTKIVGGSGHVLK